MSDLLAGYDRSNPLVQLLLDIRQKVSDPPGSMQDIVPLTSPTPFYRMGEPIVIPVSPTTAATAVPVVIPPNVTTFKFTNPNPFCVRLRGRQGGKPFVAVTPRTGWLWLPWSTGIYMSLQPIEVSAMSIDAPDAPAGTGWIELQYGTGY